MFPVWYYRDNTSISHTEWSFLAVSLSICLCLKSSPNNVIVLRSRVVIRSRKLNILFAYVNKQFNIMTEDYKWQDRWKHGMLNEQYLHRIRLNMETLSHEWITNNGEISILNLMTYTSRHIDCFVCFTANDLNFVDERLMNENWWMKSIRKTLLFCKMNQHLWNTN